MTGAMAFTRFSRARAVLNTKGGVAFGSGIVMGTLGCMVVTFLLGITVEFGPAKAGAANALYKAVAVLAILLVIEVVALLAEARGVEALNATGEDSAPSN